jgi:outer membrane protein assembly factor BamE (lipoprotein component of BamABCDE complex)
MRFSAVLVSVALLLGCTPVVNQRGYLPDPVGEAALKVGTDTKTTVQDRLGDPSTEATFGGDVWYYISSVEKQISFFDPRVENRSVMAVHFDKDGKVADIRHYSLKDGHVIALETRETPAKGRELTFLQQLMNATPGVPLGNPGGQNPGQNGPPTGSYP